MYRLQVVGAMAILVPLLAAVPAASQDAGSPALSPQEAIERLAKVARVLPKPWPRELAARVTKAELPSDLFTIFEGEAVEGGALGYGFEDDNGWPALYWDISGLSIKGEDWSEVGGRLHKRLEKLGYRQVTHTTFLFDWAFHRKTADADFVVFLTNAERGGGGRMPPLTGKKEPGPVGPSFAELRVHCWVRSTHRSSLPTYAETLRAIPSLELSQGTNRLIPPQVLKTLMDWPVTSVQTRPGSETKVCIQFPRPVISPGKALYPRDLVEGIPDACLAAGYNRYKPLNGRGEHAVRVEKFDSNAQPGECDGSSVEIDSEPLAAKAIVTINLQYKEVLPWQKVP